MSYDDIIESSVKAELAALRDERPYSSLPIDHLARLHPIMAHSERDGEHWALHDAQHGFDDHKFR